MRLTKLMTLILTVLLTAGVAFADGNLHFYNWGNYTPPDLLKKFTKETGIKVTLDNFDSNEMMLAKIKAGGHGYDLTVPSAFMVKNMIGEGLLQKVDASQMSNFKHVMPSHVNVYFDPGRQFSVPYAWGSTGISLNTKYYNGPKANSWALVFDPPDELKGKINMLSEMTDVIAAALFYLGLPQCNSNKADLRKVNDLLLNAKKHWATIDYGIIEKMSSEDVYASQNWNGASMRVRAEIPEVKYIYPKEGLAAWSDNVVMLKDAKNVKEAKLFMNFLMAPENAAMVSNFARYANSIKGSEKYMDAQMPTAPEIIGYEGAGEPQFIEACGPEINKMYTKIWNNLLK